MIGFVSDIHGNLAALSSVLEALDRLGVTRIYSLGDLAGYYPEINECAGMLRARGIVHLLGNHDAYLTGRLGLPSSRSVTCAIAYQKSVIEREHLAWLAAVPEMLSEPEFYAVHGGIGDPLEEYAREFQFPGNIPQTLFLTGHTHIPALGERGGKRHCNPGSVGQPRDGDPRAAFAVLRDDGRLTMHRVPYDIAAAADAAKRAGFPARFYEGLYTGERIGANDR